MELHAQLIEFSWTLVMVLITMLIFFLIMKHFFFEKVHNFMLARQNAISEAFENAERTNQMAEEKLSDYKMQIEQAEGEGREIIKNARSRAELQAKSILDEANSKSSELIFQAERQIENEKVKAVEETKQQIAALAIYAAEKIVEKQIEEAGQNEIIDKIIEQAGKTAWQR